MSKLIPKNEEKQFKIEMMYTINCPIITMVGFEDDLSKDMKSKYTVEAMLNVLETFKKEEAPDYHVCIYLSQVSLTKPLGRSFTNIYLHLMQKQFKQLKDDKTITSIPKLDEYETDELVKLKKWIFKKQIEHIKTKL
jgi:hypothetical protein